jgi:hypothetical protein
MQASRTRLVLDVCGCGRYSPPIPKRQHTDLLLVCLAALTGLGTCAIFAAIMVPAFIGEAAVVPTLISGLVVLVGALAGLWVVLARRDRTLR